MAPIGRPPVPVIDRFLAQTSPSRSGCTLWTGVLDADGYGQITVGGRTVRAHRWSYEHHVGPIPNGLVIDHLCRVRECVNPDHMEPVTPRENTLRGISPIAMNAAKTTCKNGHPLVGRNLVEVPGGRACRTCRVEATRRWRAQQKKEAS